MNPMSRAQPVAIAAIAVWAATALGYPGLGAEGVFADSPRILKAEAGMSEYANLERGLSLLRY